MCHSCSAPIQNLKGFRAPNAPEAVWEGFKASGVPAPTQRSLLSNKTNRAQRDLFSDPLVQSTASSLLPKTPRPIPRCDSTDRCRPELALGSSTPGRHAPAADRSPEETMRRDIEAEYAPCCRICLSTDNHRGNLPRPSYATQLDTHLHGAEVRLPLNYSTVS